MIIAGVSTGPACVLICFIFKRANAEREAVAAADQNQHLCLNSEEETTFQSKGHLSLGELVCKTSVETLLPLFIQTDQYNDKEIVMKQDRLYVKKRYFAAQRTPHYVQQDNNLNDGKPAGQPL